VEYRPATAADADQIARLHAESWRRTYRGMMRDEFLDGDVVEDRLAVWGERLRSPVANQHVVVAEDGGEIRGFVCVYGDDDARWGSLVDNLHVRHDVQKGGTGRALMREAAAWCAANYPGRGLYLWVMQANENAQRFYERLGGSNEGAEEHENTAGGGIAHVFRYAWSEAASLANG
jgi:ribosomal protein S18 acetylase RimI-like enzyme